MRSLNYVTGIILLLSFAVTGLAQDWQLIRYVTFEDGSNGGQSDLVYQDERFTLSGPFAPILHYGDHSLAFVASSVSPYTLQTPEPVGFQLQLTPDFEYRFSLSVETWSGNDIGFYLVGPDQQEILINGPVGTRQRDPSWTPGNVDLRDLYINGWDVIRISNTFTVPTAGEYYVYIRHYNSSNTYVGSSTYESMYDLYDLFKLEARALNNTTHLSFSQTTQSITEGSSTQLCVDISNPSSTFPTEVDIVLFSDPSPHFEAYNTEYLVFPAGSSQQQCIDLEVPFSNENAPSTFYDFTLQNGVNQHQVVIGEPGTATVEVLQGNGLSIVPPTNLSVLEGSNTEICIQLQQNAFSYVTAELSVVGNASPHFSNNQDLSFVIPPGDIQVCKTISIPFSSNTDPSSYQFVLQNLQGSNVVITTPNTLEIMVTPDPDNNCWESELLENFSSTDNYNFSNLSHIANSGYVRTNYGANGSSSDACARATSLSSGYYFGLEVNLTAGEIYQLSWNGKAGTIDKSVDLYLGTSANDLALESGPYLIPQRSITQPGADASSDPFTVSSSGVYYVVLKKSSASSSSGDIRLDDLLLERYCGVTQPSTVYFSQQDLTVQEGNSFDICVEMTSPSGFGSTQVEVALAGNTAPHLASFSTTTSTFPAGDGSAQCFSVNIPANGNLDGDVTYTFILQNPSGPNSPALIHPDTLLVTVTDDVDLTDCNIWAADGTPIIFDNYAYALPGGFLHNTNSHMETLYPDYPGDKSFFGIYNTSFYLGIPYQLEPGYEYRLRWHSKGYRYGNLYVLPQEVDFGTSLASAITLDGTFYSNVENTSAVVSPDNAGQYYFIIKGASYVSKSDIFLDDFILERRCKGTEVNFVAVPDPVQAVEGNAFTVCLRIETPSPYQSTVVGLDFPGNKSPHFNNTAGLEVTFPAGSSADQCIDIPSTVFQGADPHSEYLLEINNVTGGIHPQVGEQDTKLLQVNESLDCWNPLEQQSFASATSSLSNIPNFVNNNSAIRSYYGATGTSGDRCARMQLNSSSKYIGFHKTLESGKYYQLGWNIKSESVEKEVYLSVSSFINVDQPVGASRIIQAVDQTTPGQAIRFEYFTVPISGTYYLFIKSDDGKSGYLKFDDFFLEERCPPAELFFTQSTASVEEGLPLEVCVNIANPHATEGSTAVVGFRGNQYPHFANSSSQTVYFPSASTEQQCVVFSSIGNGAYDESLPSYTLELKNPSGAHGPILGTPDEMLITLEDDVDLSICEWAGPDAYICLGDTVQLGVDYSQMLLFEDCADEDYCFRWEPASEILFDAAYQQEPFVSPAQSTWFTIYMTDGQGNLFMDSVFVEVSDGPDFVIASDQTHLCTGDSLTLTANIQEGSGSYSYAWSTGATTPGTTVYTGDTYSLSITDLADGCTSSQSITIAEPNLSFAIAADHDFICTGSPNSILTVPGADATNYQYLWSTSETSASISINQAGEYQLTLTDVPYGCDTVLQYTVQDVDQELSMAIMATDTVLCENDTLLLSTTIDGLTLDTEEVTYLWSNDQGTPSILASQAGTYSVTVTFGGVCSLNTSITLTEAMLDLAVISTSGENFACPESPLTLTSSTLDSTAITAWSWSTGETSETITVSEVGTFSLTVTDQNGCPFAADFTVEGCPTVVFLEQELVQIKDDETAEVCVGIVNPGTAETTVDVVFLDTKDPHFTAQPMSQTVTFAAGVNSLCLDFPSVRIEDADSVTVYALQLANATGGTNATIGLARETSIAVEAAIRCQVEQDSLPVNCELSDTSTIVSDVPLISRLEKEDSFWAGDFEVEVVSSNGDGTFNGQGIIRIPYFNQVRVNVRMDNVQINEDCQMVAGEVVVLGVGAELLSDELQNALDDLLSTLDDIEDVITVIDEVLTTVSDVVNTSSQIGEVLSEDWNVLHGGDPLFDEYPYLPDSLGQQLDEAILCYLVNPPSECSDQLAEVIDAVIAAINEMFEADYALRFNPYEAQSYGFDSLMYAPMASDYNRLVVANQPYNVAWKSVESGMSDHVLLDRDFDDLPTDLTFEKNDRSTLQPENDNGKTRLPITGLAHEEVYQIYPVQNKLDENNDPVKKYAGKLNVISYDKKEVEVVLVPVNGAGANLTESDRVTIESSLNDIYQPAVASMTVELETNLTLDWFDGSLDTTGSSLLRVYNPEMLRINRGYRNANNNIDPNKYYIFLIASSEGDAIDGFMPFGKKNGYAIAGGNSSVQQLSRAIAHELGHGAFYLQHPFNEYNLDVGATNNLMDYGIGTHLAKYQWDIIHNPSVHISLFDDGEEAQLVSLYNVLEDLNHLVTTHTTNNEEKSYLTFMSNTGQPVILEADKISSLTFATGGESYIGTQNFVPIGTLTHFTVSRMLGDLEIVTSYTNCFDGLYYPNITSNFECAGDTYVNPTVDQNIQQLKPIVLRHSFKLGSPILHYIELGNEVLGQGNGQAGILSYDHYISSFFEIGDASATIRQVENTIPIDFSRHSLSDAFGMSYYLDFVAQYPEKAEYTSLGSFYISGLAVLMQRISNLFTTTCTENRMAEALYKIVTPQFAEGDFDEYHSELTQSLIQSIHGMQYYAQAGLSSELLASQISSLLIRNARVDSYNEDIANLNGDTTRADALVDRIFSASDYLSDCEYAGLIFENDDDLIFLISRIIIKTSLHRYTDSHGNSSGDYILSLHVNNSTELVIMKFLRMVPDNSYVQLLSLLDSRVLETNGTNSDYFYYSLLIDGVDDSSFFDNYGLELINFLIEVYGQVLQSNQANPFKVALDELTANTNEIVGESSDETIDSEAFNTNPLPIIPYNYRGMMQRVVDINWLSISCSMFSGVIGGGSGFSESQFICAPFGPWFNPNVITDVELANDGAMEVYHRNKLIFHAIPDEANSVPKITLRPFQPIILDANSTFGQARNLQQNLQEEGFFIIPAIALLYLDENAISQTTEDVVFTVIDVATLAFPVSKIHLLSKIAGYLDKASSVVSLVATYANGEESMDPETKAIINITSAVLGLPGIILDGGGHSLSRSNVAGRIRKSEAINGLSTAERNSRIDNVLDHIENNASWTTNANSPYQNENLRYFMINVLEQNRTGHPNLARLDIALTILRVGFDDIAAIARRLSELDRVNSPLPNIIRTHFQGPDDVQALRQLKEYLLANDDALLRFHASVIRTTPNVATNNLVTGYNFFRNAGQLGDQSDLVFRLERLMDDIDLHPEMEAFLSANNYENLSKWTYLNRVGMPNNAANKVIVEWMEDLWMGSGSMLTVQVPAGNKVTVRYQNNPIAEINETGGLDIGTNVHNFGDDPVDGRDIVAISPDGSTSIVHNTSNSRTKVLRCACFPAGTLVHTAAGTSPIENLKVNDYIKAYDTQKQDTVMSQVLQVAKKTWYSLQRVVLPNDTIWATGNHPFYLPDLQKYLPADSILSGMKVLTLAGALLVVQSVAAVDTTVSVYNFEVADHHNYFVGEAGVLVHNTNGTCPLWRANLKNSDFDHVAEVLPNVIHQNEFKTFLNGLVDDDPLWNFFRGESTPAVTGTDLVNLQKNRVRAWEVFATSSDEGLRGLKTKVSDLEILGNYFGRYPESVELIREGLEGAINKRGYLDWVKHVDTDFEDYHFVFRDWEFGSNKLAWSEYFENLKNSSNFDPFPYEQTIEDLLQSADYSQLSKSEGYAIFSYTTIFYQKKFDRWLREGINSEMTSPIANLLTGALDKMPIVPANVNYYRGVNLSGEDLSSFLARHAEGADVTYQDFTSAANNVADSFLEGSNIRITILPKEGSSGRTIYDFSFGKFQLGTSDEAVFKSGFRFNVESVNPLGNDVYEFVFREL